MTRLLFDKSFWEVARKTKAYMEGAGLTVWTDACGNVHGTWSCGVPEAKTVYMGSHLDTVKEGGLYDGMLGVVGAVEAFRAFLADPAEKRVNVHILATNGEEGNDLGGTFGSRAMAGLVDPDVPGYMEKAAAYGTIAYIEDLKRQGVIHHIGLSSHTPKVVEKVLDMHILDMLMFSINPAYDYRHGEYAIGSGDERAALYRRCEAEGVGISVMKAFSAGQLLDAKTSPFGQALTEYQCMQYALDCPGVLTVLPGVRNREDLKRILGFLTAAEAEKDYSILGSFTPAESSGVCVYCNHCQPCPASLDVGLINKYYDLAKAGDDLAKDHYAHLERKASDCITCGHCDSRCPFHVKQSQRMKEIANYFGG